jgi:hypothetical protein
MAEKKQRYEQNIQKLMKPEVDNIKCVFSGDERFMRLSTYYRQNNYHPLYSLRTSISIILQIPFFIAAYHFLSNLELINNVSFGPLKDLAKPDSLLVTKNITINILPLVMTIINCLSAVIYSKGFSTKDKLQLYGMATLFLVLLYNSPSILVLYWTGNNIYSLIKNIIQKILNSKYVKYEHAISIIYVLISVVCLFLDFYLLIIHKGSIMKRLTVAFIIGIIPILPLLYPALLKMKKEVSIRELKSDNKNNNGIFILSLSILFILAGLWIPSSLIASSVQEFSFIGDYKSPFHFIINILIQSLGIFIIWPICIYLMLTEKIKKNLAKLSVILVIASIINIFIFPGNYGYITILFTFPKNLESNIVSNLFNLLIIVITSILVLLLINRSSKIITACLSIAIFAFILLGVNNTRKIYNDFQEYQLLYNGNKNITGAPVYQFSKNGKNILVIMLDRGISGYIPYIFQEKPELNDSFDGFTWYKNTISFGGNTNFGSPGIFGGYEYTPLEMQSRKDIPLVKKHNEALLMLPRIFLENGFMVTVTDPPYANYSWIPDLSIFADYPQIKAENVSGKYTEKWLENKEINMIDTSKVIESNLIRFAFFKSVPLSFRKYIYDNGNWLMIKTEDGSRKYDEIPKTTLDKYIALDVLSDITLINENEYNTYNVIANELTHEPYFLLAPDYVPSNENKYKGNGPFAESTHYHVNIAAILLLSKWFDFLKANDVYDNTRIIIVSDHGWPFDIKFPDSIALPRDNRDNHGGNLEAYAALLMVKDFNTHGTLKVDNTFMTNADVPSIALKNIIDNTVNPWTGNIIKPQKTNGIILTTSYKVDLYRRITQNNIMPYEWLHVHDDIFNSENWTQIEVKID